MTTEFGFIDGLRRRGGLARIGDDCAVLPKDPASDLVVTADMLIEDVDFRRAWASPEAIGHKALAVSLSDVAAMGAKPVWSTVSIGLPEGVWKAGFGERFYDGYLALASRFGVELVGGDISKTPDKIVIDSVVGGEVARGSAILRSNAKPGDMIFVTGSLGGAAGGLRFLEGGADIVGAAASRLVERQLKPEPEVDAGLFIAKHGLASAMIDLSDGISGDLAHIAKASGVGARIFAEKIPLDHDLGAVFELEDDRLRAALDGGEDFRLLFTTPVNIFLAREKLFAERGFTHLGEITANEEIVIVNAAGESSVLDAASWRHF